MYFDTVAIPQLVTDASLVGLEAVMLQIQNGENELSPMQAVVLQMWRTQFANRKGKERKRKLFAEYNYACERFYMYLYGIEF